MLDQPEVETPVGRERWEQDAVRRAPGGGRVGHADSRRQTFSDTPDGRRVYIYMCVYLVEVCHRGVGTTLVQAQAVLDLAGCGGGGAGACSTVPIHCTDSFEDWSGCTAPGSHVNSMVQLLTRF